MNRISPYLFATVYIMAICTLAACMTPRQSGAAQVLYDLYDQQLLTKEQLDALLAALSPSTWVSDVIAIGSGLLGGTGAFAATNIVRNRARAARGEPIGVPKPVDGAPLS